MREMKDSGIEWIGAIPTTWHTKKMKYISNFIQNKYSSDYGLLPYIGLENIASWSGSFISTNSQYDREQSLICEPEDILFGKLRPYLAKVYMNDRLCCCSNEFAVIRVNGQNKRYIWYQLLSHGFIFEIDRSTYGTKMPRANAEFIRNVFVALPSEIEQQKIANYLDKMCAEIDAVLEKTRASIEEYKKLKQAVITQAVTKGIFDKQIYPHNVKLKYLLYIASGDAIRNEELSEVGKYPAYGGGESLGFASKYNTLENSLIVGRVGARCGCVTYIDSKAWATDNALIVHPICNPRYMYYMLIYSQLNNLNTSNAQPLITATKIKNVVVPYFLEDICQKKIVDFLDEKCACIDAIIEKKQQYLTEIENYKKSLIYEYVTGKKEVV